jgi:hypothetical protein
MTKSENLLVNKQIRRRMGRRGKKQEIREENVFKKQ